MSARDQVLTAQVSPELRRDAAAAMGQPAATPTELIRYALARLAGYDDDQVRQVAKLRRRDGTPFVYTPDGSD